ncbi:MAG: hypothetical protein QOH42_301 [Blastocatellia bacterium]|nr:hypothetical protein [Blastocatellia bacterium]
MNPFDGRPVETVEKQKTFFHRSHTRYYYELCTQDFEPKV